MITNWKKLKLFLWTAIMGLTVSLSVYSQASAASQPLKLTVNNKSITTEVPPFQQNNVTYIPFRDLITALGGELRFQPDPTYYPRSYDAVINGATFSYAIDKHEAFIKDKFGQGHSSNVVIKNNRVFVPLRWVSENLGAEVKWDKINSAIKVTLVSSDASSDKGVTDTASQPVEILPELTPRKIEMNASFTAKEKYKNLYDMNTSASIEAKDYAVKDEQFYSHFVVQNGGTEPMIFTINPGNQRIIQIYSKKQEERTFYRYESCSRVSYHMYNDGIGGLYKIPDFYDDQDCIDRNNATKAEQERWNRENNGTHEEGSDIVTIRAYVQGQDGSYTYKIKPEQSAFFIIQAPANSTSYKVSGSYYFENSTNVTPYSLTYDLSQKELLGMGMYSLVYTWPTNGAPPKQD